MLGEVMEAGDFRPWMKRKEGEWNQCWEVVMEAGDCRPWMKRKKREWNQCWEVAMVAGEWS
jgi:hypothetical protein